MDRHPLRALALLGLLLAWTATAGAAPDPPPAPPVPPGLEEVLERLARAPDADLSSYLAELDEETLGRLLDHLMATSDGGWRQRAVSNALGSRVLDRRAAGLRALGPPAAALAGAVRLGVLDYPRTDGSTSTIPLARLIACRLLGAPYAWGGPPAARTLDAPFEGPAHGGAIGLRARERPPLAARAARRGILADASDPAHERLAAIVNGLLVRHTGTHGAWVALIEGKADFVLVAREPSPDERALATARGVALDVAPVARDAFAFLVNRLQPVTGLTLEQVRRIYAGALTTWDAVGGEARPIQAFQRDRNSGSQELFLERVMRGVAPVVPRRDLLRDSMIGPLNAVADGRDALGYTVWYYERYMAALPEVKVLAIDGVQPEPDAIADGRYPLVTTVVAAVRADAPAASPARRLRDWLLTEAGQAVVAESGYVPLR